MFTILTVFSILLVSGAQAHSHLANPLPTRRLDCRVGNGRHRDCHGPCPALDRYGEPTGISPNRPAQVWRRGERRWITWHRNNHGHGESGFVRFTLVPVDKMMDKRAHDRFAFQISCWSSGLHTCPSRNVHVCGNDAEGKAYKVEVTVPTAYPDGVYVFGWSWYGGGDYLGRSFFGDYYSCSFVRIEGGHPITSSTTPVFKPGLNQQYRDACMSATDRLGVCYREPCRSGHVRPRRPSGLPRAIYAGDLGGRAAAEKYGGSKPHEEKQKEKETDKKKEDDKRKDNSEGGRTVGKGGRRSFKIEGMEIYDVSNYRKQRAKGSKFGVKVADYRRGFTVGLRVSGKVNKVVFRYQGRTRTELKEPYIINGNRDNHLKALDCRKGKKIRITAVVYGANNNREERKYRVKCK